MTHIGSNNKSPRHPDTFADAPAGTLFHAIRRAIADHGEEAAWTGPESPAGSGNVWSFRANRSIAGEFSGGYDVAVESGNGVSEYMLTSPYAEEPSGVTYDGRTILHGDGTVHSTLAPDVPYTRVSCCRIASLDAVREVTRI